MMGQHEPQLSLFAYRIDLERRVPADHPLRPIAECIDFSFVRTSVASKYGHNGNESVDPEILLKLMFLLFFDNVASERELMRMLPYRLDYLWFLKLGLDDEVPNHSVLSKARRRWGAELFEELFIRAVTQCVEAGLVDGSKLHIDGSLVDANASKGSVRKGSPELIAQLRKAYGAQERKLDPDDDDKDGESGGVNHRTMSETDPDSALVRKQNDSRPRYKHHRTVDNAHGVITAVKTTSGDVKENGELQELVEQHTANTGRSVDTVVGDKQYGTVENFLICRERGIRSHMGDFQATLKGKGRQAEIYDEGEFRYDAEKDVYHCPAGQILTRRKQRLRVRAYEYAAPVSMCAACPLRANCTKSTTGARTIKRHMQHEEVLKARAESHSAEARRDRQRRKWLMEGSFADAANNHGFKRARWRRLWRQRIQDYLIAAVQNIRILLSRMPARTCGAEAFRTTTSGLQASHTDTRPFFDPFTTLSWTPSHASLIYA